jgi:3'-phosphoadenosine 5'-phosphosulfate sulfotransferase (PAPS reductase)/FAD synthetase
LSNKRYGQPFVSKQVSEFTMRLQLHNFKFEDKPYETLIKEYPKCKSALEWWCNCKGTDGHSTSSFDINRNKYLKEFMVENPPTFRIANKCCEYAKKNLSHEIAKEYNADLMIVGIRKGEGGARARAYKNCFTDKEDDVSSYRPIFWYSNQDKVDYEKMFSVVHSDCYTKYGLPRTGCCGCPCSRTYKDELNSIKNEEPNLYKAAKTIFKDSYEYTEKYYKYRALRERQDESEKRGYTQMNLEDFL